MLLWPRVVRRHLTAALVVLLALTGLLTALVHGPLEVGTLRYLLLLRLGAFFLAGMLVWSLRERLPARTDLAALCAGSLLVVGVFADPVLVELLTPLPLSYLLLVVGGGAPVTVGARTDISYGVYIYAFPVQQLLAVAGAQRLGPGPMAVLALALVLPLAWASWHLVERPCLALKGRGGRPGRAAGARRAAVSGVEPG